MFTMIFFWFLVLLSIIIVLGTMTIFHRPTWLCVQGVSCDAVGLDGKPLSDDTVVFAVPPTDIGPLLHADSTMSRSKNLPLLDRFIAAGTWAGMGFAVAWGLDSTRPFTDGVVWKALYFVLPLPFAFTGFVITGPLRFCRFVCADGFAVFQAKSWGVSHRAPIVVYFVDFDHFSKSDDGRRFVWSSLNNPNFYFEARAQITNQNWSSQHQLYPVEFLRAVEIAWAEFRFSVCVAQLTVLYAMEKSTGLNITGHFGIEFDLGDGSFLEISTGFVKFGIDLKAQKLKAEEVAEVTYDEDRIRIIGVDEQVYDVPIGNSPDRRVINRLMEIGLPKKNLDTFIAAEIAKDRAIVEKKREENPEFDEEELFRYVPIHRAFIWHHAITLNINGAKWLNTIVSNIFWRLHGRKELHPLIVVVGTALDLQMQVRSCGDILISAPVFNMLDNSFLLAISAGVLPKMTKY